MKTLLKLTLLLFTLSFFQSCTKDEAPTPEPIAQPEPEPIPEPENQAPTAVTLISPAADSENIDVRPAFSWEAATDPDGDAITYEIYVDTTGTPATLVGKTTETSFEVEERLGLLESYNWKVLAKDGKGGENESALNKFDVRNVIFSNATTTASFGRRASHKTVVFEDKVWIIGGAAERPQDSLAFSDTSVYNSIDGATWNLVTESANFPRGNLKVTTNFLVYKDKIWLIGGMTGNREFTKDIWNSEDGITWNLINESAGYRATDSPENIVVFDNKMWMINDEVWFSEDGVVWSLAYDSSIIEGVPIIFNDKFYVFGGAQQEEMVVHVSEDGFNWTTTKSNSDELFQNQLFSRHNVVLYDDKIWEIGAGRDNNLLYTKDGINWTIASDAPIFPMLFSFSTAVKDDKLWVIGGRTNGNRNLDDVWFIN